MRRCKMILRDEKGRSWSVQLGPVGPRFGITKGWRQFREANAVQEGDTYKFELVDNGTIPIAYFRCESRVRTMEAVTNACIRVAVYITPLGCYPSRDLLTWGALYTRRSSLVRSNFIFLLNFIKQDLREKASFQPEEKKSKSNANANRQFVSTIDPYSIRNPYLVMIGIKLERYLPLAFAKSNGLVNRR
ncbi:B3 domain-containing protein REM10-like [Capsicum annuum]